MKLLWQLYILKHSNALLTHLFHFQCIVCIISFVVYYIHWYHYIILYQFYWFIHSNWNNWYNPHNWHDTMKMLHSILQCAFNPICLHYLLRDQPKAHELTNHILHPSNEPSWRSPSAPGKRLCMLCSGTVQVSPTGTTGSFPRIFSTGTTSRIGFL